MENNNNDRGISQFYTLRKNYEWVINDFMIFEGQSLSSPTFSTEHLHWKIEIKWKSKDEKRFGSEKPFRVTITCERKNKGICYNEPELKVTVKLSFIINREEHILIDYVTYSFEHGTGWCVLDGDSKTYDKIKKSLALKENTLTVVCSLILYTGSVKIINELRNTILEQTNNDLSKDLSKLLEDKTYCDITLVTEKKEFTAHKAVLVARSPVFYAMFKTNMVEKKENRVDIKNVKPAVLSAMLSYIYSQKVENIDEIDVELLEVAERFGIEGLKILCSGALLKKMSVQNVAETLIWADLHNAAYVKTQALNFIALNKNAVIDTEGFKILMKSHPNLRMEILQIIEIWNRSIFYEVLFKNLLLK